ncbi:MAG TPA: DUF1071 domain-containing protein [Burkholderiaceae bacterium]|nr:DUF1071 domain-containing protein [Burkholderiaceae bacterium]
MSDMSHQSASINPFTALAAINVNDHVEKKAGFSYLSWPFAVAQLRQFDPTATWEVRRFDGLPFLVTEAGVFVEVAVCVQGVTLSQIHPVLDGRNRPLMAPSAFDINTSIQRCLVKAIALHGLGLYIYAGEDLPQVTVVAANDSERAEVPAEQAPARPTLVSDRRPVKRADGGERISKAQQAQIHKLALEVGISLDRVLAYFNVSALSEIAAVDFLRVMRSLEKRRAA